MKKFETMRYEKIINELINSSFPILKNKKIKIKRSWFSNFSASVSKELFFGVIIWINPKYDVYDDFELKGLLAHELSHLEDWEIWGRGYKLKNDWKCFFSSKYKEEYEKKTDIKVILKGYKDELRAQRLKREGRKDKNFEKLKRFYLSVGDIDKIAESLK